MRIGALYLLMCWITWKARKELASEGRDVTTHISSRVVKQMLQFKKTSSQLLNLNLVSTTMLEERLNRWVVLPDGWFKLNSDGVSKGNPGLAGGGGLLRSTSGDLV